MLLAPGGIDIFYVDESGRSGQFVLTSVMVPLLRKDKLGWRFVWDDYLDKYKRFRRDLRGTHGIPARRELHAQELASGRGRYGRGGTQLGAAAGSAVYRWILGHLSQFLPDESVITVVGNKGSALYGEKGLDACLVALFQRMQRACQGNSSNGMTFFDEGHGEYLHAYRKARRYLPTGSFMGRWASGHLTKNVRMDRFFKDGNFKDSKYSLFVQAADLVAYAAVMLRASELGTLTPWQQAAQLGLAYSDIPKNVLNRKAAGRKGDPHGIVRL